jgi:hypothetical protein
MTNKTAISICLLYNVVFSCIAEIESIDKLIYNSKVVVRAKLIECSKPVIVKESWHYYDLYFALDKSFKGDSIKPKFKVRVYGHMYDEYHVKNIDNRLNNNKNKIFFCFLNDTNFGQHYCNKFFGIKNDYDYVPTVYMDPVSLFDFGHFDNDCLNVIIDSNLNEITEKDITPYLQKKVKEYSNGSHISFVNIPLNLTTVNRIKNIKRVNDSCDDWLFYATVEKGIEIDK